MDEADKRPRPDERTDAPVVGFLVQPVIKFNNTSSKARCLLCEGFTDLPIGAQIFNEGSYQWICDHELEDHPEREMIVWRNRAHGWPADMRIEPD